MDIQNRAIGRSMHGGVVDGRKGRCWARPLARWLRRVSRGTRLADVKLRSEGRNMGCEVFERGARRTRTCQRAESRDADLSSAHRRTRANRGAGCTHGRVTREEAGPQTSRPIENTCGTQDDPPIDAPSAGCLSRGSAALHCRRRRNGVSEESDDEDKESDTPAADEFIVDSGCFAMSASSASAPCTNRAGPSCAPELRAACCSLSSCLRARIRSFSIRDVVDRRCSTRGALHCIAGLPMAADETA